MKKIYLAMAIVLMTAVCAHAQLEKVKKSVLYINSYHHGYRWSDSIFEGIREALEQSEFKIDLQVEHMDTKKYDYDFSAERLLPLFRDKFRKDSFDVVIVSDNDAFTFALDHREELFPGVPIVFCGVNDFSIDSVKNVTGVVENFPVADTLDLALELKPYMDKVIVVGDRSTAGRTIRRQVEAVMPFFEGRLEFEYWSDLTLRQVLQRTEHLPPNAFLFFIPYYVTLDGRSYTSEEVVQAISNSSNVPIFTAWEFLIGHGALGGSLISGYEHGRLAAMLALRILRGENADEIPIIQRPQGDYFFDYNVMKKLGIKESQLPDGSRIVNMPKAFYELPKQLFWTIMIFILVLVIVLVFLTYTIVERKRVEKRIKEQLSFQEILMDTIPQLVSWKDSEQRYLGANRAFTEFFGIGDPQALMGRTDSESLPQRDFAEWAGALDRQVVRTRKALRKIRRNVQNGQGREAWLELNKVPLFDQNGKAVGTLSTAENITKERDLEKQLIQSQKMEAIGTLAGGIAHDFNNILTSIINSTELAMLDVDPDSLAGKDLDRVLKAARRGGHVVKQILAFSRPSQEGFRPTDIGEVVEEVLGLVKASMPGNIQISAELEKDVPATWADPTQLHQVVLNLCTNSFQALRETGGILRVELGGTDLDEEDARTVNLDPGHYLRLAIIDNGPGIPAEILDKIFDPFFTTKGKAEGTGLGLAVVHGIVKGHNGGIRVSSSAGKQTAFEIYLPLLDEGQDAPTALVEGLVQGDGRILFVEDDPDQLETTPRLLESLGYSVSPAADVMRALEFVAQAEEDFDLVITDFDMPGANGVDLAETLADIVPGLPLLLVSGREDAVAAASGLPNIKRVVIKPYDKNIIAEAVATVLSDAKRGDTWPES
jgi:PAS domain S-box-containing protein